MKPHKPWANTPQSLLYIIKIAEASKNKDLHTRDVKNLLSISESSARNHLHTLLIIHALYEGKKPPNLKVNELARPLHNLIRLFAHNAFTLDEAAGFFKDENGKNRPVLETQKKFGGEKASPKVIRAYVEAALILREILSQSPSRAEPTQCKSRADLKKRGRDNAIIVMRGLKTSQACHTVIPLRGETGNPTDGEWTEIQKDPSLTEREKALLMPFYEKPEDVEALIKQARVLGDLSGIEDDDTIEADLLTYQQTGQSLPEICPPFAEPGRLLEEKRLEPLGLQPQIDQIGTLAMDLGINRAYVETLQDLGVDLKWVEDSQRVITKWLGRKQSRDPDTSETENICEECGSRNLRKIDGRSTCCDCGVEQIDSEPCSKEGNDFDTDGGDSVFSEQQQIEAPLSFGGGLGTTFCQKYQWKRFFKHTPAAWKDWGARRQALNVQLSKAMDTPHLHKMQERARHLTSLFDGVGPLGGFSKKILFRKSFDNMLQKLERIARIAKRPDEDLEIKRLVDPCFVICWQLNEITTNLREKLAFESSFPGYHRKVDRVPFNHLKISQKDYSYVFATLFFPVAALVFSPPTTKHVFLKRLKTTKPGAKRYQAHPIVEDMFERARRRWEPIFNEGRIRWRLLHHHVHKKDRGCPYTLECFRKVFERVLQNNIVKVVAFWIRTGFILKFRKKRGVCFSTYDEYVFPPNEISDAVIIYTFQQLGNKFLLEDPATWLEPWGVKKERLGQVELICSSDFSVRKGERIGF